VTTWTRSRCKAAPIQDAVNELFGWQTFFDGIPGLLLAMYYGSLADRIGRRPVLALSLLGMALSAAFTLYICWIEADVRLSWFSALFTCVGGGGGEGTGESGV
jgi:MFS family permease